MGGRLPDLAFSAHLREPVSSDNEWSPLRSVVVGRASYSCFPPEPLPMIAATMPAAHVEHFRPNNPFPAELVRRADVELDRLVSILEMEGIQVRRPETVDWRKVGGYTGAMVRDGLLTVANRIIESPFAWRCRKHEIELSMGKLLDELAENPETRIIRAPQLHETDTLYEGVTAGSWQINNTRPAFDAADFMRFGKTILGQLSHVTNESGVEYLRQNLPLGYSIEIIEVSDPKRMHIDTTLVPLRNGLLVYHPEKVTEESLRKHDVLKDWEIIPFPFIPQPHMEPPLFTTSAWIAINVLVLDGRKVLIEENDVEFAKWLESKGMIPIQCPFRHVYSLGGSFHCSTLDLIRD